MDLGKGGEETQIISNANTCIRLICCINYYQLTGNLDLEEA